MDASTEFPNEYECTWVGKRKWLHQQKMERKELDRYERGSRRTADHERTKDDAERIVRKMRTWLKSPYAFRRGGL